jgi:hypothetical protein
MLLINNIEFGKIFFPSILLEHKTRYPKRFLFLSNPFNALTFLQFRANLLFYRSYIRTQRAE